MALTSEEKSIISLAAKQAADRAIKQTFLTMGVDISTPDAIKELQQDNAWVRRWRMATSERSGRVWLIVFSTLMGVVGSAVTLFIQQLMGVPPL